MGNPSLSVHFFMRVLLGSPNGSIAFLATSIPATGRPVGSRSPNYSADLDEPRIQEFKNVSYASEPEQELKPDPNSCDHYITYTIRELAHKTLTYACQ